MMHSGSCLPSVITFEQTETDTISRMETITFQVTYFWYLKNAI